MTDEKPLNVRVAEALGCKPVQTGSVPGGMGWFCDCERGGRHHVHGYGAGFLPPYDTDWGATGPLIERFGIMVHGDTNEAAIKDFREENPDILSEEWTSRPVWFSGQTTLVAVCSLILALGAAGKLDA